jgi:hypothetical protein
MNHDRALFLGLAGNARSKATRGGSSRRLTREDRHKSAVAVSTETDALARKKAKL